VVGGRFARGVPTYYVEWHLREAWRTLLFSEPHPADIDADQDPVLSASRSEAARRKAVSGKCFALKRFNMRSLTAVLPSNFSLTGVCKQY